MAPRGPGNFDIAESSVAVRQPRSSRQGASRVGPEARQTLGIAPWEQALEFLIHGQTFVGESCAEPRGFCRAF